MRSRPDRTKRAARQQRGFTNSMATLGTGPHSEHGHTGSGPMKAALRMQQCAHKNSPMPPCWHPLSSPPSSFSSLKPCPQTPLSRALSPASPPLSPSSSLSSLKSLLPASSQFKPSLQPPLPFKAHGMPRCWLSVLA
eukprot:105374-Chlamydomonas_euryale.AAC.1